MRDDEIQRSFFKRPVLDVAPDMLGKVLAVVTSDDVVRVRVTEVEAYDGPEDKACHASKGRTERTEVMFREGGHIYVYLIYGMYNMLNIVTGEEGYPSAVLIRGVESINGPGRLTRDLGVTRVLNGLPVGHESGLWFEDDGLVVPDGQIERTPRIGVAYAGEWAEKPYRFIWRSNQ